MDKVIGIFKKRQNLVLGLLIVLFLTLIFLQTVSIADIHGVAVKDFSIMRPTSVPGQGDVKTMLGIFKNEIGAAYSFDCLYNTVYTLILFGIVALFMCFGKFNKGLVSKIVSLAYGVYAIYALLFTKNVGYILKTYDGTYIPKIVVAALLVIISIIAIVFIIVDLAKNSWLKEVNVHIFLNSICSLLMLAVLALMFIPFEFKKYTASVMGYMLMPSNYAGGFDTAFRNLLGDATFNSAVIIPILIFVLGVLGSIFATAYYKNIVVPVMAIVWSLLVALGCFINPLIALDGKFIIYLVIAVLNIAVAVINLIQHHKANAIYRQ